MSIQKSPTLPVAHVVLQILIILNWLMAVGILAMLIVSIVNEKWFASALNLPEPTGADWVLFGFRTIMVLGLAAIPVHYVVLKRLLAIIQTVRAGDPFVASN